MPGMRHQPQGLLRLERAASAGMRLAMLPGVNRVYDAASMRPAAQAVGMRHIAFPGGLSAGFGAAVGAGGTDKITTVVTGAFPAAGRTYFVLARRNGSGGGNLGRLFDKTSGSTGQFLYWSSSTGLNYGLYAGGVERTAQIVSQSSPPLAIGEWFAVLVAHEQVGTTATVRSWVNGLQGVSSTFSGVLNDAAATPYCIGNRNSDNARGWDGAIACAYAWDRILSDDEIAGLFSNSWRVWADDTEGDEPAPVAPAGYVLPVDAAALAIAGGQVGMRMSRRLRAEPAGLNISGGPFAVRVARRMDVQPAGLDLLVGQVQLTVSRRLGVQPAALTLTGHDLAMRANRRMLVEPATLGVAGQGAALRAGRRVQITPVAMVLAGGAVAMQYNPMLAPGYYTLPVSAAAMTLAGGGVGMRVSRRMVVTPGQIRLAGGAIAIVYDGSEQERIDASIVPPRQTVVFEGSHRVVSFEGGKRVVSFDGSKRLVEFQ